MLAESERISKAKEILSASLSRVYDRTMASFKTRLDATNDDFNVEKVRNQLNQISHNIEKNLGAFQNIVQEQASLLVEQNKGDQEVVGLHITNMLLSAENLISTEFERADIAKHWKTRRHGGWGYLSDMQGKIANRIFPTMEVVLNRYIERFNENLSRIRKSLERLQQTVVELEQNSSLNGVIEPLNITEVFDTRYKLYTDDLNDLIESHRRRVVGHLDDFISDKVRDEIYEAKNKVPSVP